VRALLLFLAAACAAPPRAAPPRSPRPIPSISGNWTWTHRAVHPLSGDLYVQEERWQLEQAGADIRGHYDRIVTRTSTDGRPYRCNAELSLTHRTRYEVRGTVRDGRIEIEETDYTADAGPCDDGLRALDRYVGTVGEDAIVLRWGSGRQTLQRSPGQRGPEPEPIANLSGEWIWEHRTVDADGDRKVESERWVLEQRDAEVLGHYESVVTLTAGGPDPFQCNQSPEYTMRARFEVAGRIEDGNRLVLRETSYRVDPGPCERGRRRLASYRGSLSQDSIVLDWGAGRQTLRRP